MAPTWSMMISRCACLSDTGDNFGLSTTSNYFPEARLNFKSFCSIYTPRIVTMHLHTVFALSLSLSVFALAAKCPCGWRFKAHNTVYTHRLYTDFSTSLDARPALNDPEAAAFNHDWMIYNFEQGADNPKIRLNAKYDFENVEIVDKHLVMKQRAYSQADLEAYRKVSMARIQSRTLGMTHGTYRTIFKLEGDHGGACAGFFWYHVSASNRLHGTGFWLIFHR